MHSAVAHHPLSTAESPGHTQLLERLRNIVSLLPQRSNFHAHGASLQIGWASNSCPDAHSPTYP